MAARVLFVCTGNAGRSQMGQALFRRLCRKEQIEVHSAGVEPWPDLHPMARKLMAERAESLEGHHPKHVKSFSETPLDYVITIGEPALKQCPDLLGNPRCIHWDIGDPADADGTNDSETVFRNALSGIEQRLPALLQMVRCLKTARELHLLPGMSTSITGPESFEPERHLSALAKAGFRVVELYASRNVDEFDWMNPDNAAAIKAVVEKLGLTVWSVHAKIHPSNLGSVNEQDRKAALGLLKWALDFASDLGAQVVAFHPRMFNEAIASGTQSVEAMLESLTEICGYASGLPCVPAWENEPKGMFGFNADDVLKWLPTFPFSALGFVCDTGHAHQCGDDTAEYLPAVGRRLRSWHLHDNYGDYDAHGLPNDGTIDWNHIAELGHACQYTGPLILEGGASLLPLAGRAHYLGVKLASKFQALQ